MLGGFFMRLNLRIRALRGNPELSRKNVFPQTNCSAIYLRKNILLRVILQTGGSFRFLFRINLNFIIMSVVL